MLAPAATMKSRDMGLCHLPHVAQGRCPRRSNGQGKPAGELSKHFGPCRLVMGPKDRCRMQEDSVEPLLQPPLSFQFGTVFRMNVGKLRISVGSRGFADALTATV